MSTHTPGPWFVAPHPNNDGTRTLISTHNPRLLVCEDSDAMLIAEAPDMYDAITELLDTCEHDAATAFERLRDIKSRIDHA